jgi:hypothetical protein
MSTCDDIELRPIIVKLDGAVLPHLVTNEGGTVKKDVLVTGAIDVEYRCGRVRVRRNNSVRLPSS